MVPKTIVYFVNENLTLIILIHSLCILILFTIQAKTDILTKPPNTETQGSTLQSWTWLIGE